jgi:hypothetical protein
LDSRRTDEELWGGEVPALGVGPLVEVNTAQPVDMGALAAAIRIALGRDASRR